MSEAKPAGQGRSLDHICAMLDDMQFKLTRTNSSQIEERYRACVLSNCAQGPDARSALLAACTVTRDEHRRNVNLLIEKLTTEQQALKRMQAVIDAF